MLAAASSEAHVTVTHVVATPQMNLHQVAFSKVLIELELAGGDISNPFNNAWRIGVTKKDFASKAW